MISARAPAWLADRLKEYVEANGMTTTDAIIDALDAYLPAKKTE